MIYIYALVGFSLLRAYFSPGEYLYCSTLWQCTVTVIRYGLIGDMFDVSTKNILNKLIGSLIGVKKNSLILQSLQTFLFFFFQNIKQNGVNDSFETFWPLVLYHVSFFIFITTIGLNIIFGIIVDTFSELRDLKVRNNKLCI